MTGIVWVGDPGDRRVIGSAALDDAADRLAAELRPGDVVGVVLPPVPELVVTLHACERVGAGARVVHVLDPMDVGDARVVVTSSALGYRGELVFLKERVDDAIADVDRMLVVDRTGWMPLGATMDVYHEVPMRPGRDEWFPRITKGTEPAGALVEAPSLREIVGDPACLITDEALLLYESYLEPGDAGYVGASGTSLGSRPPGRLA